MGLLRRRADARYQALLERAHQQQAQEEQERQRARELAGPRDWARAQWARGGGPDLVLRLRVGTGQDERLAALVEAQPMPGFVRQEGRLELVDRSAHERGRSHIFNLVRVDGPELLVLRALGGHGEQYESAEVELLVQLARDPELEIVGWQVRQEGQGVGDGALAAGIGGAELLRHLDVD